MNECGLSIRKFAITLDQFRGQNIYYKVGMTSKIVSNYYEVILTKDDKYKTVERGFQKYIGAFANLSKDADAIPFQAEQFINKVKENRKIF